MEKVWVARMQLCGHYFDKDLSPKFSTPRECIDYINNNFKVLEYLLNEVESFIDLHVDNNIAFRFGCYVRAYNIEQKRYVTGFDL